MNPCARSRYKILLAIILAVVSIFPARSDYIESTVVDVVIDMPSPTPDVYHYALFAGVTGILAGSTPENTVLVGTTEGMANPQYPGDFFRFDTVSTKMRIFRDLDPWNPCSGHEFVTEIVVKQQSPYPGNRLYTSSGVALWAVPLLLIDPTDATFFYEAISKNKVKNGGIAVIDTDKGKVYTSLSGHESDRDSFKGSVGVCSLFEFPTYLPDEDD